MLTVGGLEQLVNFLRAIEVFLVPPSGDVEERHVSVMDQISEDLFLPKVVKVRVSDEIVPRRNLAMKVPFIRVRQRSQREIPLVCIELVEFEVVVLLLLRLEQRGVFESVAE